LFTLKNARLSSNSYNFGTQANIAMKFAEYVVCNLLSSSVSTVNLEKKFKTVPEISNFSYWLLFWCAL